VRGHNYLLLPEGVCSKTTHIKIAMMTAAIVSISSTFCDRGYQQLLILMLPGTLAGPSLRTIETYVSNSMEKTCEKPMSQLESNTTMHQDTMSYNHLVTIC
jgi:hypothetical protein